MTPGSQAWVWIVLRAVRPGRWAIPYHVVNYSADGVQYSERIPRRNTVRWTRELPTFHRTGGSQSASAPRLELPSCPGTTLPRSLTEASPTPPLLLSAP